MAQYLLRIYSHLWRRQLAMTDLGRRKNILIIAEGFEEKPYIDKILSFPNINKDTYNFAKAINVKGNGNIPARFQFEIQRGFYDAVLIFCDADKDSEQFYKLVCDIRKHFFSKKEDAMEVFIFANPVTLQIVLSHFGDVNLTKVGKKSNAAAVEDLTGIKNYEARKEQISEMISKIHFSSINEFKRRLANISTNFNDVPSTNFLTFLERFESSNTSWIDKIDNLRK